MSLFTQQLHNRATLLALDVSDQESVNEHQLTNEVAENLSSVGIDVPEPSEEDLDDTSVHETLANHIEDHADAIEEINNTLDADITLQSLHSILVKSAARGGMSTTELETFALVKGLIARQVGVTPPPIATLLSVTIDHHETVGSANHAEAEAHEAEAASKTLKEKFKEIIARLVKFAKRILETLMFSWKRIFNRASKLKEKISNTQESDVSTTPITSKKIIEPLYRKGAHLSVNFIREVLEHTRECHTLFDVSFSEGKLDLMDTDTVTTLVDRLQEKMKSLPDHSPQIVPSDAKHSVWERLKVWKKPESIENLPTSIERLTREDCIVCVEMIYHTASMSMSRDSKTGMKYLKNLQFITTYNGTTEQKGELIRHYPTIYSAYCRINHWSASYANAVLNYVEASLTETTPTTQTAE